MTTDTEALKALVAKWRNGPPELSEGARKIYCDYRRGCADELEVLVQRLLAFPDGQEPVAWVIHWYPPQEDELVFNEWYQVMASKPIATPLYAHPAPSVATEEGSFIMDNPDYAKYLREHPRSKTEDAREVEAWKETAAQGYRDRDFYRGLIVKIGEMFGEAAYISDDGSVQQDVLALKVPELVAEALAKLPSEDAIMAAACEIVYFLCANESNFVSLSAWSACEQELHAIIRKHLGERQGEK